MSNEQLYKLIFYVPKADAERVKSSVFNSGAGSIRNYSHCCWETEGVGQFMPLTGSNPTIGNQNRIEKVIELRVEVLCSTSVVKAAIEAMKSAHPYEEPAYEVVSIQNHLF